MSRPPARDRGYPLSDTILAAHVSRGARVAAGRGARRDRGLRRLRAVRRAGGGQCVGEGGPLSAHSTRAGRRDPRKPCYSRLCAHSSSERRRVSRFRRPVRSARPAPLLDRLPGQVPARARGEEVPSRAAETQTTLSGRWARCAGLSCPGGLAPFGGFAADLSVLNRTGQTSDCRNCGPRYLMQGKRGAGPGVTRKNGRDNWQRAVRGWAASYAVRTSPTKGASSHGLAQQLNAFSRRGFAHAAPPFLLYAALQVPHRPRGARALATSSKVWTLCLGIQNRATETDE